MTTLNTLAVLARLRGSVTDGTMAQHKRFQFRPISKGEATKEGGAILCSMFVHWVIPSADPDEADIPIEDIEDRSVGFWVQWATDAKGVPLPPRLDIWDEYWYGIEHVPEVLMLFSKVGELAEQNGHEVVTPETLSGALLDLGFTHYAHPKVPSPKQPVRSEVSKRLAEAARTEEVILRDGDLDALVGFSYRRHPMKKYWRPAEVYASVTIGHYSGRSPPRPDLVFKWKPMDDGEDAVDENDLGVMLDLSVNQWRFLPVFHEVVAVMARLGRGVNRDDDRISPRRFLDELRRLDMIDRTHARYRAN